MTRLAAAALVSGVALLVGCTATPPDDEQLSSSTSTRPPVHRAELRVPETATTVIQGDDAATLAAGTSAALFRSSPLAVVAPAGNHDLLLRAASMAVALGVPLLVDTETAVEGKSAPFTGDPTPATHRPTESPSPSPSSAPPDATDAELERLGVVAVLTVGNVTIDVDPSVTVVPAPEDDDDLDRLLDLTFEPVPVAPAENGIDPVVAVSTLDRTTPTLLTTGPAGPPPPTAGPTTRPTHRTTDPPAGTSPGPTLPSTELADTEPTDGALVLTTGDVSELAAVATARSADVDVVVTPSGDPRADPGSVRAIAAATVTATTTIGIGASFGTAETLGWKVATAATGVELPGGGQTLFPGRRMVAMYGTPTYPALGILGEQDAPSSIVRAQDLASRYQPLTVDTVVPAFEIIVTIASSEAGPDGNYSNELPVEGFIPWVEAARDAGVYVVLDLQPGRTDFLTQAKMYEPLLRYPNVGLALDPEWRLAPDQVHLRQIGSVGIDEINAVGNYLAQFTRDNALPQKLFVLHEFTTRMIQGRENLNTSHEELAVLIHVDGQGGQGAKAGTWQTLHLNAPPGVWWGWKNFIDEDSPMLTPVETYQVQPVPHLVSYQ